MKHRKNHQNNQGFTLIELMIVVAIIAILAMIAIPAYKDYVTRAKVTELINIGSTAKTSVAEYAVSNGTLPKSNTEAGVSNISTPLVSSVTVGNDGAISIVGNTAALGAQLTISLEPTLNAGTVTWSCHAVGDTQYAPANCRN